MSALDDMYTQLRLRTELLSMKLRQAEVGILRARSQILESALGGGIIAIVAFGWDHATRADFGLLGAADPEAAQRVVDAALGAILVVELSVLLISSGVCALIGAFIGIAAGPGRGRFWIAMAGTTVICAMGLGSTVARYPQLYAMRWWQEGSPRGEFLKFITHESGPQRFDAILCLALGLLAFFALLKIRMRFRRWVAAFSVVCCIALIAVLDSVRWQTHSAPQPNLLIIAIDSLRADRIGDPAVMPRVSRWLENAYTFDNVIVPIARTFPSWVSILTGAPPRAHGIRTMFPTAAERAGIGPTLYSELQDHGYRTFVSADFVGDIFPRFDGGFDEVDAPGFDVDVVAQTAALSINLTFVPLLRSRFIRNLIPASKALQALAPPAWLVERTLGHIDRDYDRAFAGLAFFGTAHLPYAAPFPYYINENDSGGPFLYYVPADAGRTPLSAADIRAVKDRYDGALRAIDAEVGALLDALDDRGLTENTMVVITSDHGELLLESPGLVSHGDHLNLDSLRVPIAIKGPGIPRGRSSEQVRSTDLAATVLNKMNLSQRRTFGHGVDLFAPREDRTVCVETGMWFFEDLPTDLRTQRQTYKSLSQLLQLEGRDIVLNHKAASRVETAKARGIIDGDAYVFRIPGPQQSFTSASPNLTPKRRQQLEERFKNRCAPGNNEGSVSWNRAGSPTAVPGRP